MFIIIVFVLSLFSSPIEAILCLTTEGYVLSEAGVQCAECQFESHLDSDGSCVDQETVIPSSSLLDQVPTSILSECINDDNVQAYCSQSQQCVASKFGIKCSECNDKGFMYYDIGFKLQCECYSARLNPLTGCQQTLLDLDPLFTTVTVSGVVKKKVTCDSFQGEDPRYGCFKLVDSSEHEYGTPYPPIPTQCCHENLGPPPGELVYVGSVDPVRVTTVQETCRQVGGIDPDTLLLTLDQTTTLNDEGNLTALSIRGFRTCHGHGNWNTTTLECECFKGWSSRVVGEYPPGTELKSCTACDVFRGPDPLIPFQTPPFCSKIYTPNGRTGSMMECGGGGTFQDGECNCFANATAGYWALLNLTYLGVTVESCGVCISDCPQ